MIVVYTVPPRKKPKINDPITIYSVRWYSHLYELVFDSPNIRYFLSLQKATEFAESQINPDLPTPFIVATIQQKTELNIDYKDNYE